MRSLIIGFSSEMTCRPFQADLCRYAVEATMGELELRPAVPGDLPFLDELNTSCMKQYVELLMEWSPNLFQETYDPKLVRVLVYRGDPIGMLKVRTESDHFYLGDVMIASNFQNRGFGTALVKLVLREAKEAGLPLKLQVLKGNPAKSLYERLGFRVTEEIDMYFRMEKPVGFPAAADVNVCKLQSVILKINGPHDSLAADSVRGRGAWSDCL